MLRSVVFVVFLSMLPAIDAQSLEHQMGVKRLVGLTYPWFALLAAVQGKVELVAVISPDGTVESVRVLAGPVLLAPTAVQSLRKWRFEPCAAPEGKCETTIVFSFVITDDSCEDLSMSKCQSEFQFDVPNLVEIRSRRPWPIIDRKDNGSHGFALRLLGGH